MLAIVLGMGVMACGRLQQRQASATAAPASAAPLSRPTGTVTRVTATYSSTNQPAQTLDWLRADGGHFVDESGRSVILRGFVTTTNYPDGAALNYTAADYQRMKALGANYQSIRIGVCAIGAWPGCQPRDGYLQQLDSMVQAAKQEGIYSEFKLTMYDLPGQPNDNWTALWRNSGGQQDAIINGWKTLWQRYESEPAVVGYDLLNEPQLGNIGVQTPQFVQQYLNPFYQRVIDVLRQIDSRHIALFQPVIGSPPYNATVGRDDVAYAPHFYPQVREFLTRNDANTSDYPQLVQRLNNEAQSNNAPLIIGEYGMPYNPAWDNQPDMQQRYQAIELAESNAFDHFMLSASRPWWADDRAGVTAGPAVLDWAVLQGRDGLGSPERRLITDIFARPYPARVAGTVTSFGFDFGSRTFTAQYTPSGTGTTEFALPRDRAFGGVFQVTHSGGVTGKYDPESGTFTLTDNSAGVDPSAITWDEASGTLSISDWGTDPVTLTVTPA
jgi:hypothetical protein